MKLEIRAINKKQKKQKNLHGSEAWGYFISRGEK